MPSQQVLAVTDSDGRPIIGNNYDPVTHQFAVQQCGPAATDATTAIIYAPAAEAPVDGFKPSYSSSINSLAIAAAATDVFTISGVPGKTIRLLHVEISGLATTAGTIDVLGITRSTANTGGTSTNPGAVPHDSLDVAAGATLAAYTVNPATLGTAVGKVRAQRLFLNVATPTTGVAADRIAWDFGVRPSKGIVLRGVAQSFAINLAGGTIPAGGALHVSIEWTEDTYS